jgi:hypothetical protein
MPLWRTTAALAALLGMLYVSLCRQAPAEPSPWALASVEESSCPSEPEPACKRSCDESSAPDSPCRVCRSSVNPGLKARDAVNLAGDAPAANAVVESDPLVRRASSAAPRRALQASLAIFLLGGALRN